jgi:hypothetical protein
VSNWKEEERPDLIWNFCGPSGLAIWRKNGFFDNLIGRREDGMVFVTYAPVELVSFTITVEDKKSDAKPREIGFAAEMRERAKREG